MIRVLVMIAVTGFLVSVVTLSTAVAIGGPELLTDAAWNGWGGKHFRWNPDWDDRGSSHSGADGKRDLAWTGGDSLTVEIPADVRYTQAPGPAKLTITGPQRELDALELEDGHLRFTHGRRHWDDLVVVMSAPNLTRFDMVGSGRLAIDGYRQAKLIVDLSGNGSVKVKVKGETKALELSISGSGESDLSELKVGDAKVDIDGSGEATLAPTGAANINISGSGEVTLIGHPAKLESNVSGSGSIHQRDGSSMAPAAPEPPAAPESPKRGRI